MHLNYHQHLLLKIYIHKLIYYFHHIICKYGLNDQYYYNYYNYIIFLQLNSKITFDLKSSCKL